MTTIDAILADIDERGRGRTRYDGQEPRRDEMMAAEIRRLRATIRINGLRAGFSHDEIDVVIDG